MRFSKEEVKRVRGESGLDLNPEEAGGKAEEYGGTGPRGEGTSGGGGS